MSRTSGILLAAGSAARMGFNKLLFPIAGKTALERSFRAMCAAGFDELIIAVSEETRSAAESLRAGSHLPVQIVTGGGTRQASVFNALKAADHPEIVAIHDAARCLVLPDVIRRTLVSARDHGSGVAAVPARDTLRRGDGGVVERDGLYMMQTPQSFRYDLLLSAYEKAERDGFTGTDDCALFAHAGYRPVFVAGDLMNQKLTIPEDIPFFQRAAGVKMRVGCGEDTHRLAEGRKLILGGVEIPFRMGLLGHSDADALLHAVIDALFGAAALGDIGRHFPDSDPEYEGADSMELLKRAYNQVYAAGYAAVNIDSTILAQEPRLAPYVDQMARNIETALALPAGSVSVKAKTPEHTGPEGRLECISARCTVLLSAVSAL